jgi:predicted dehydrogenase/threonine dehydrogenase-like Zn-dependent dehydrogenase
MKRLLQNFRTGELSLDEAPMPLLQPGCALVKTAHSLISAGTEKTKVDAANMSLLGKARSRPDLVKQVLNRARKDGLWKTWEMVSDRLNTPVPLGYSSAGTIVDVKGDVDGLTAGTLVACAGGTANHAEMVVIPKNLLVPVPAGVTSDQAAFATIGAIALQGVRQAEVRLGDRVAVIGLGLIGLLTVQILRASGARVFGIDINPGKLKLALELGADAVCLGTDEGLEEATLMFTDGYGFDTTLITAASSSNVPIEQSAVLTREKGRVVVLGLTKMDIPRDPFYLKELDLRLSRSYGPGRYDRAYEEEGHDYPFAYVRYTEQRNLACFLELVANGRVNLAPIITHRFTLDEATRAYDLIRGEAKEPYLGILLEYPRELAAIPANITLRAAAPAPLPGTIRLGVIGAGKYATGNLLPHLTKLPGVTLGMACTASGVTATHVARKFGFASVTSDSQAVVADSDAIVVATRHQDHAALVLAALALRKPVFVEKPLTITSAQLDEVERALQPDSSLMVGFNRRFAPATDLLREHFRSVTAPKNILIRVNAGVIPKDHWVHDPQVGGGRLIGEGCHFVDLAAFLAGHPIRSVAATAIPKPGLEAALWDDFSIILELADGSVATIVYTSIGDNSLPKELIEVSGGGRSGIIHDFMSVDLHANGRRTTKKTGGDKGQAREMELWIAGLQQGASPIPVGELLNVHRACFAAIRSLETRETIRL